MKKFALTSTVWCAVCALSYAGPESYSGKDKEVLQPAPPPCEWYRAHEWDLWLWGTYAFPANTGDREGRFDHLTLDSAGDLVSEVNGDYDLGRWSDDKFINRDGAWGGGIDVKYFFSKYWALGAEGFVLDTNDNIGGAGLATLTFRYPIGCSRFAPYAFAGFGVLSGGSQQRLFFFHFEEGATEEEQDASETEFFHTRSVQNKQAEPMGQFGAGMEIRITRPTDASKIAVGLIADFAWNVVDDVDNNFGMGRFGLSLSY